jgi:hypothetical protein
MKHEMERREESCRQREEERVRQRNNEEMKRLKIKGALGMTCIIAC